MTKIRLERKIAMVTDEEVLEFFRDELPTLGTWTGKLIPVQLDDVLQQYTDFDDLSYAMDKYAVKYNVDVDVINFDIYYPWEIEWFFRKWFTNKPIIQTAKPLTIRMFAESAKSARWLYD